MAILRKLRNAQTYWQERARFVETSQYAYLKTEALFGEWKNCHALSSVLKFHLRGFV